MFSSKKKVQKKIRLISNRHHSARPRGKRIVFRADGSKKIGFGHLARSATLALELRKIGYEVLFLTSVLDKNVVNFLDSYKLDFMGLAPPSIDFAIYNHLNVMDMFGAVTTVLDSYTINDKYRKGLKDGEANIAVIDDVYKHYSYADVIINHNPSADSQCYKGFDGEVLSGTKYSLIDSKFASAKRTANDKPNIMVMMGGSDAGNQTGRVLKLLDSVDAEFRITALKGFYPDGDINKNLKHETEFIDASHDIPAIMAKCDAAVTAGGITTMELAASGVPFMLFLTNFRQLDNAKAWGNSGAGIYGGDTEKISDEEMLASLKLLISIKDRWPEMGDKGKQAVDALGATRVARKLDQLDSSKEKNLSGE